LCIISEKRLKGPSCGDTADERYEQKPPVLEYRCSDSLLHTIPHCNVITFYCLVCHDTNGPLGIDTTENAESRTIAADTEDPEMKDPHPRIHTTTISKSASKKGQY